MDSFWSENPDRASKFLDRCFFSIIINCIHIFIYLFIVISLFTLLDIVIQRKTQTATPKLYLPFGNQTWQLEIRHNWRFERENHL
jgi:hypothetical protein